MMLKKLVGLLLAVVCACAADAAMLEELAQKKLQVNAQSEKAFQPNAAWLLVEVQPGRNHPLGEGDVGGLLPRLACSFDLESIPEGLGQPAGTDVSMGC